jgi:hypothetical protein
LSRLRASKAETTDITSLLAKSLIPDWDRNHLGSVVRVQAGQTVCRGSERMPSSDATLH